MSATEPSSRRSARGRRPRRSTRELTARIAALSVAAALSIGGLIAGRMAAGEDPALGPRAAAERTSVVVRTDDDDSPPASPYAESNQQSVPSSPAPVVTRAS